MSYTTAEYESARRELERRRNTAEREREKRHSEVAAKVPEILETEKEMSAAGLAVVKAVSLGEDAVRYVRELEKINLEAQKKREKLLVENGFPADYLKVKYTCEKCGDKGFVNGRMCECHKTILRSLAYEKLCGKFPLDKCTFGNFNLSYYPDTGSGITPRTRMESVYNFCKNYAEDFNSHSPSILMSGETGLGKTHLSLAIAGEVIKKGKGVIYASAQNLLNRLENEKFGRSDKSDTELNLIDCDLLILDDLGSEFRTQFTVSAIYNIVNSRLLSSKPTIISTNLTHKEIDSAYTSRIASRILSEYTLLQFDGTDIRQIKTRQY